MIMMLFRIAQRVTKYLLGYFCKKSAAQKTAKMPNLVTLLRACFLMPTIIILAHRQYAQLSLSLYQNKLMSSFKFLTLVLSHFLLFLSFSSLLMGVQRRFTCQRTQWIGSITMCLSIFLHLFKR